MVYRSEARVAGQPLVELMRVSKRFMMHREARRSLQEAFIHLFERGRQHGEVFWPVHDVSLAIQGGDSLGIIGPNGSGKSTLLKLISGVLEPTSGEMAVRCKVSSMLELGAGFHGDLTGRENIYLNGSIFGMTRRQMKSRIEDIIEFAELGDFIDVPVKHYSSGMYVRLGFAVAIHTDPDLLVVDEVLAVGDTAFQHKCMDSIQQFRDNGGTLVLVSHSLATVESLCRQAVWLDHGSIRGQGEPTDVVMAYLNSVAEQEELAFAKQSQAEPQVGRRWGSGHVQITDVQLCDSAYNPCSIFVEGDFMAVRLRYLATERVEDPIFGIGIHSQNGFHLSGPNTRLSRLDIPFVQGEGEVIYEVPALPLLEGTYSLSAAVVNRADSEMYDYHDRLYPFRVYPGKSGERLGVVRLNGTWRLAEHPDRGQAVRRVEESAGAPLLPEMDVRKHP